MQIIRGYLRRIVFFPTRPGVTFTKREVLAGPSVAKPADATGPSSRRGGR
jgi:hypothetical protein